MFGICLILSLGLLGVYAAALPQQPHVQRLVYYPPPPTPAPILRARRQVLGGSLVSNPSGGADARLDLSKAIGTPEHNVIGQVFAAGNTQTGGPVTKPVTSGASLAYNKYVHQLTTGCRPSLILAQSLSQQRPRLGPDQDTHSRRT